MAKIALLIGISEYEPGLAPLPKAVNDVEAMRRVLVNPEMGDFAAGDVTVLKNPQRQEMEDAIYDLYANREKEDLLLFYFSGHGVKVDNGDFYFSTRITRKDQEKLRTASAVAATSVHGWMSQSKSKRQAVILDCCFSGAFAKGMTTKDAGSINLQEYLGGEGRAILTASTSTQYAFESDGLDLSIYTHYLVEGIEKGAADKDGDGWIAVDELHGYAKSKVQEASPAMTPEFYPFKDGYRILLAKSPKDDPRVKYRKEVERLNRRGKLTIPGRRLLNSLRLDLKLDPDVADAIEVEVQQPYREYQRKLEEYEATLVDTTENEPILSEAALNDLRDYQQHLGLRDEDVAPIEERIIGKLKETASVEELTELIKQNQGNQFEFDIVIVNIQGEPINRSRGRAEFFAEELSNGVVLEMVSIPGGKFLMGSPPEEAQRYAYESPQHEVTVPPFFMGKYPITQAQWRAVADLKQINRELKSDPSNFKGDNLPVEQISWYEVVEFCDRLSKQTNRYYRLPSEAEWEYACRSGTTTPFYFGETITSDLANYSAENTYGNAPKGKSVNKTTEVGNFKVANAFGLYDMHGNVWEWCYDHWHNDYKGAPTDGSAWIDIARTENDNHFRLLRGGSWFYFPRNCRSAYRNYGDPDYRLDLIGFRVVGSAART